MTLHVNLERLGTFTESARVGLEGFGGATDIEMGWIVTAIMRGERDWGSVNFYRKIDDVMTKVHIDEPDWSQFTPKRWFTDPPTSCGCLRK